MKRGSTAQAVLEGWTSIATPAGIASRLRDGIRHHPKENALPTLIYNEPLLSPKVLTSALSLNPAWPPQIQQQDQALIETIRLLQVELDLTSELRDRLLHLYRTLQAIEGDEIADWSLNAICHVNASDGKPAPVLMGIGATIYATGEVYFFVNLDGIDTTLWLVEDLDLSAHSPEN